MKRLIIICFLLSTSFAVDAQHSIARQWNEMLLTAIRSDLARPTVHARNLYHVSVAMYDAWAVYNENATPYLLGNTQNNFHTPFGEFTANENQELAVRKTISYAAFTLLKHRFEFVSPQILEKFDSLMVSFGYDPSFNETDFSTGNAAALGCYIGESVIAYGLTDGSNEIFDYRNDFYQPTNSGLDPTLPGNPTITDPNRWQPLILESFIDQSGNEVPGGARTFLSPEWGNVHPFALTDKLKTDLERYSNTYQVYMDPSSPPQFNIDAEPGENDLYKWNFELVAIWSGHLSPKNSPLIDISPASKGNLNSYPNSQSQYPQFYDLFKGGTGDVGYDLNPVTHEPYAEQWVPLGDYARVLAEFWADGPNSETPPGHWFTILNYVNDHPLLLRKIEGTGSEVDALEWDIKSYFLLGAGMHDAAVTAWSIKGWYDYIRPISAIRFLADLGQSTDPSLPNYNKNGIRLYENYIEIVDENDSLASIDPDNIGKIKIMSWRGPEYIDDESIDEAGVGWILAENWWPYQRPSFVTPPFAGYISGHSTFSRTAAELLTQITGSPFFPGGLGEFTATKNEFLVFEEGPSQDIVLQWATYQDASDETSLSRIWGGIHPPADDIPGRLIGIELADIVYKKAATYFSGNILTTPTVNPIVVFPNPVKSNDILKIEGVSTRGKLMISIYDARSKLFSKEYQRDEKTHSIDVQLNGLNLKSGIYVLQIESDSGVHNTKVVID